MGGDGLFDVGMRLKTVREEKGFSQQQLSELAGLDRITINRIEKSKLTPSLKTLNKICSVLGITISYFFESAPDDLPPDLHQLVQAAKKLTQEQREAVTKMITAMIKE